MPRRFLAASATLALVLAASAAAQTSSAHSTSFDITIGALRGSGGDYFDYVGVIGDLTLVPSHNSPWITAVTLGAGAPVGHGDVCVFNATGTGCLDRFPSVAHLGLLGGLEHVMPGVVARGALGPAFYFGEGGKGLGPMLRVDLATAGFSHLGFVIVGQGELIIRSGETLRRGALMAGMRLR
jgi:hypothetical protein